jgi:hypothetical protein
MTQNKQSTVQLFLKDGNAKHRGKWRPYKRIKGNEWDTAASLKKKHGVPTETPAD